MMECIKTMFPNETKFIYPDGSLFTWVELPEHVDTTLMLENAKQHKVAYMPGKEFFCEGQTHKNNCMRIQLWGWHPDRIETGMKRLADLDSVLYL